MAQVHRTLFMFPDLFIDCHFTDTVIDQVVLTNTKDGYEKSALCSLRYFILEDSV